MAGRPSKLSPAQKAEIRKRMLAGETQKSLAIEYGVSWSTIKNLATTPSETVRRLALVIAEAETQAELLPIVDQSNIRTMADQFKKMSQDYTRGASTSLETSTMLHEIAREQVGMIDKQAPNPEGLKMVAALTKTGNDASTMATNLLTSQKDSLKQDLAEKPHGLDDLTTQEVLARIDQIRARL